MKNWLSFLGVTTLIVFAGCNPGPERAAVQGMVSYKGEPVTKGRITFIPAEGTEGTSVGTEIEFGSYNISPENGAAFGKYRVQVSWSKETGKQVELGSPSPPGTMIAEVVEVIPAKYNTSSTLTADIHSDKQELNFDLEE